jgi:hypothetical protein
MEPLLTTIVAAFVAGATAKLKDVSSEGVSDAYEGLKSLLIRKLGKSEAVQNAEKEPDLDGTRAKLAEAIASEGLAADSEVKDCAHRLENAIAEAKVKGVPGIGDIEVQSVHGAVNAIVEDLVASGRIRLGPVVAETGDARLSGLTAGTSRKN